MSADFASQLSAFAEKSLVKVDQLHKLIVFHVYRGVVLKTPVDTGFARASWFIGNGVIPTGTASKPGKGGSVPAPNMGAASGVSSRKITYIVNNAPYIIPLEYGHSDQARNPDGMMRRTLAEVRATFGTLVKQVNP